MKRSHTAKGSVDGCPKDALCRGRCVIHYNAWRKQNRLPNGRLKDVEIKVDVPKGHVRCKRRNCTKCLQIEQCNPHVQVPPRKPFEWEGNEAALVEQCGQNDENEKK